MTRRFLAGLIFGRSKHGGGRSRTKERHVTAQALSCGGQMVKDGWAAHLRALKALGKKQAHLAD
jgi:hypothetical protein